MTFSQPFRQLIRYGFVGVATNISIYSLYLTITYFGVKPKLAMTFVYVLGVIIGFMGNRGWTFDYRGNTYKLSLRYIAAHFFGYCLNLLIFFVFVDVLGYAHQYVQAMAIIVVAGLLFIVFKFFVFSDV